MPRIHVGWLGSCAAGDEPLPRASAAPKVWREQREGPGIPVVEGLSADRNLARERELTMGSDEVASRGEEPAGEALERGRAAPRSGGRGGRGGGRGARAIGTAFLAWWAGRRGLARGGRDGHRGGGGLSTHGGRGEVDARGCDDGTGAPAPRHFGTCALRAASLAGPRGRRRRPVRAKYTANRCAPSRLGGV